MGKKIRHFIVALKYLLSTIVIMEKNDLDFIVQYFVKTSIPQLVAGFVQELRTIHSLSVAILMNIRGYIFIILSTFNRETRV